MISLDLDSTIDNERSNSLKDKDSRNAEICKNESVEDFKLSIFGVKSLKGKGIFV
jgi:hypothetical protein